MSELKAYSEVFAFSCVIAFFAILIGRTYVLYLQVHSALNMTFQ